MLPTRDGPPDVGTILTRSGLRVRNAHRVVSARDSKSVSATGCTTWLLAVQPMPVQAAQSKIAAGVPTIAIMSLRR